MWPIITKFEVFGIPITIYSFGTFIVLAFLVSAFYVRRRAFRDLDLDRERVFNVCFALLFIGLGGARLLYAFIHHAEFSQEPLSFLKIWEGGLVFYGGLFACIAWLVWYLPRHTDMKGFAVVDLLALGSCLAIFVGRWASFFSGENYGKPAPDLPWGITFPLDPASQARPQGEPLHPTQLYHSLHGLILFFILFWYLRRKPWPGRATGIFLVLYALGTAIIEIWRADDSQRGMVIERLVSTSQLISIPVLMAGIALYLVRRPPSGPHG
ncbi:MAG: prolipoprotein diacylglyceryl transferase [Planctomycetota bacterium]|jgi:phosphatidylglycerol:prolipoprotein diacylglycerol transferase